MVAKKSKFTRQNHDVDKRHTTNSTTNVIGDETKTKAEENDRQTQRRRQRRQQEEHDPADDATFTDEVAIPRTSLRRSTNDLGRRGSHPLTMTPGAFWVPRSSPRTGSNNNGQTPSLDLDNIVCNDDDVDDETRPDYNNDERTTGNANTIIGSNNDEDSSVYVIPRASLVVSPGDGDSTNTNTSENSDNNTAQCALQRDSSRDLIMPTGGDNNNEGEENTGTATGSNRRRNKIIQERTPQSSCFRRSILGALIVLIVGLLTVLILVLVFRHNANGHDGHNNPGSGSGSAAAATEMPNESSNQILGNNSQQQQRPIPSPSPSKSPEDNNKKNCGGSGGGKRRLGSSSSSSGGGGINGQQKQKHQENSGSGGRC